MHTVELVAAVGTAGGPFVGIICDHEPGTIEIVEVPYLVAENEPEEDAGR